MKLAERLTWIRLHGPDSSTLRHLLEVLAWYDADESRPVYPAVETLVAATGYKDRCVRSSLARLVRLGWLVPEKPARESRPAGVGGREAWWAHGNVGGAGNSTRYRLRYLAKTLHDVPQEPCTTCRDEIASDGQTLHVIPKTLHDVPDNPARRAGDPSINPLHPSGGDTPPHPPASTVHTSQPWDASTRHAIQAEARKAGAGITDTATMTAWETVLIDCGTADAREVPRVVYDLAKHHDTAFGRAPARPYAAADLAPFVLQARASLLARRDFNRRTGYTQKATA